MDLVPLVVGTLIKVFIWGSFINFEKSGGCQSSLFLDRNHQVQVPTATGKEEHGVEKSGTGWLLGIRKRLDGLLSW